MQLRDQSCWFFAPINGITPDYIRSWMGDFSRIREAGKYAARMGQCFSMTVDAADVEVSMRQAVWARVEGLANAECSRLSCSP